MTTSPATSASSQQATIEAALLVLKSMGLSVDDLIVAPSSRPPVPTFAEYIPVVAATVTPGTLRAYRPYWKRTVDQWGERRLDEPTPSEIKQLVAYVKAARALFLTRKSAFDSNRMGPRQVLSSQVKGTFSLIPVAAAYSRRSRG